MPVAAYTYISSAVVMAFVDSLFLRESSNPALAMAGNSRRQTGTRLHWLNDPLLCHTACGR